MNINYDELLKDLERPQEDIEPIPFTEEEFKTLATQMADLGYIHTAASLDALQAYMAGYGLLLMGDVGTGKTFFFEKLFEAEKIINSKEKDMIVYMQTIDITRNIIRMNDTIGESFEDIKDEIEGLSKANVAFDDIGVEVGANDWGQKFALVPWLVEKRVRAQGRTHFTTNLSADQLLERYGARVVDRMHELATVIEFKGKSHRKTLPNETALSKHKKKLARIKEMEEMQAKYASRSNGQPDDADNGAPF